MSPISTKCATAASLFALLSLPSDRRLPDKAISHPDFQGATGYIRRTIDAARVHAVDWDGKPGVETVLRENGRRSAAYWNDVREWNAKHPAESLEAYGTRVCELLLRHFGPYDEATSTVLGQRREIERRKAQLTRALDRLSPPAIRHAAHEYLGMTMTHFLLTPLPTPAFAGSVQAQPTEFGGGRLTLYADLSRSELALSTSETVLRECLTLSAGTELPTTKSLTSLAEEIVEKARPLEAALDELDQALWRVTLPPIPCETSPADPDLIPYGRLICRHRAVIAALPLAEAGFDVELVNGAREARGTSTPHLFVYSREVGVLEASADGPEFWIKVTGSSGDPALPVLEMSDGSRYRFYHRTKMTQR
jgi:hypothetical protein